MESSDPSPSNVEWVSTETIRQRFNDGQFYERVVAGELRVRVRRSKHPETPPRGEPVCTHSQILVYYTKDGKPVALVHQYLRVNGKIGASGKPDPKWLVVDNRVIAVKSTQG